MNSRDRDVTPTSRMSITYGRQRAARKFERTSDVSSSILETACCAARKRPHTFPSLARPTSLDFFLQRNGVFVT